MASNCQSGNGEDLWTRLTQESESKVGSGRAALLAQISIYDCRDNGVEDALEKWENLVKQRGATAAQAGRMRSTVKIAA